MYYFKLNYFEYCLPPYNYYLFFNYFIFATLVIINSMYCFDDLWEFGGVVLYKNKESRYYLYFFYPFNQYIFQTFIIFFQVFFIKDHHNYVLYFFQAEGVEYLKIVKNTFYF